MSEKKTLWSVSEQNDEDGWQEQYDSKETAIAFGRREFEGRPFWVDFGTSPDPARFMPTAERIVEDYYDLACDDCPEPEDFISITTESAKVLDELLSKWAREHVKITFVELSGQPERVDP